MDVMIRVDQSQMLPELCLGGDPHSAFVGRFAGLGVEPFFGVGQVEDWKLRFADHDPGCIARVPVDNRAAMLSDQLCRVALRHAGQAADQHDAIAFEQ